MNNEENNLMGSLDFLKKRVDLYMSEETLLNNSKIEKLPISKINLRKNSEEKKNKFIKNDYNY